MMTIFDVVVGSDFEKKVIPLINNAKKNIDILMYDWRWYENEPANPIQQFNIAIVNASKRSVQIRVITNKDTILDILKSQKILAKVIKDHRTLHSKMILIDSEILIIGSHNLTKNAMTSNHELSIICTVPQENTRIIELFNNLFNS